MAFCLSDFRPSLATMSASLYNLDRTQKLRICTCWQLTRLTQRHLPSKSRCLDLALPKKKWCPVTCGSKQGIDWLFFISTYTVHFVSGRLYNVCIYYAYLYDTLISTHTYIRMSNVPVCGTAITVLAVVHTHTDKMRSAVTWTGAALHAMESIGDIGAFNSKKLLSTHVLGRRRDIGFNCRPYNFGCTGNINDSVPMAVLSTNPNFTS